MADNLFEGLPPPSQQKEEREPEQEQEQQHQRSKTATTGCGSSSSSPVPAPKPALKSALKRSEPTESKPEGATILSSKKPLILSPTGVNLLF
jgi:hypothetical protein